MQRLSLQTQKVDAGFVYIQTQKMDAVFVSSQTQI